MTSAGTATAGTDPHSVTVDPTGRFAYVANTSLRQRLGLQHRRRDRRPRSRSLTWMPVRRGIQPSIAAGTNPTPSPSTPPASSPTWRITAPTTSRAYSIDAATGGLDRLLPTVKGRNGNIAMAMSKGTAAVTYTPKFAYVANRGSDNISAYSIDASTGALTSVGTTSAVAGRTHPSSVSADPSGRFAYVADGASNNVSAYSINAATGALTHVSTVATGTYPESVADRSLGQVCLRGERRVQQRSRRTPSTA